MKSTGVLFSSFAFFTFLSPSTFALPLFAESAAQNVGNALTLYPDNVDPAKFYFMPNSSKIAKDARGVPTFSFTYMGLNSSSSDQATGLMVYVGKLTSDEEQKSALADFLKTHPAAGIAVLPIKESTISLTDQNGLPAMNPLFSQFNFAHKGGRAEDEIGINAVTTGVGTKLFKASLTAGAAAAFKWDMCYKVDGLGPEMRGRLNVKMDRVYDHFSAQASAGGFWWRAKISAEIEKLRQSNDVSWIIDGGDAKDEDYVREVTAQIIERMFKPELAANPSGTPTIWDQATPFSFGGSWVHKEELKEERWTVIRRAAKENEFCVPLVIKDIQDHQNQCVIDADKK